MGQPQFRSIKSAPASAASLAARTPSSIVLVAICTPKHFSLAARYIRLRSTLSPLMRCLAKAISPTVTSAPKSPHRRRYGSDPPRVSGAKMSFPRMRLTSSALRCSASCGTSTGATGLSSRPPPRACLPGCAPSAAALPPRAASDTASARGSCRRVAGCGSGMPMLGDSGLGAAALLEAAHRRTAVCPARHATAAEGTIAALPAGLREGGRRGDGGRMAPAGVVSAAAGPRIGLAGQRGRGSCE
mmetsp:Transcript_16112/g.41861  ORF Transcript_16112/g.41861 Transcript_16112/m.41861 type:complete len:244 (-) Transcript_16112:99-830(-)